MKVSIITAAYNAEQWIKDAYDSVSNQTHADWEWLVTNDSSSDSTIALLNEIAEKDSRVKVFSNLKNSGAAVSRNNSLKQCTGDFIAFLDIDDLWLPNKLKEQISFMGEDIDFSFTGYELIDKHGTKLNRTVDSHLKGFVTYEDMLRKKATLGCSTVMLRKSSFSKVEMPLIRTGQDYALWLNLLKIGKHAHVLSSVLSLYRIVPDSISRNKFKKAKRQWEIYRGIERLDFVTAVICFGFYAYRAVFRKR